MSVRMQMLPLDWAPMVVGSYEDPQLAASLRITKRLGGVLRAWEGTPYAPGQQRAGTGVDCVRFVLGVADEMFGAPRVPVERLPQDTALHDRRGALQVFKTVLRIYPELRPVSGAYVEPGDLVVVGPASGGAAHVLIVGPRRHTLWHADGDRVSWTGWALDGRWQAVQAVYRFLNRRSWDI